MIVFLGMLCWYKSLYNAESLGQTHQGLEFIFIIIYDKYYECI